jgi:hypothetical protein
MRGWDRCFHGLGAFMDSGSGKASTPVTLKQVERAHILQVLEQTGGVVGGRNGAAAWLGMRRTTLLYKMQQLGINPRQNSAQPTRPAESSPAVSEDISHTTGSPRNAGARSDARRLSTLADAEREHISEAVEMTSGLCSIESYNPFDSFKLSRHPRAVERW